MKKTAIIILHYGDVATTKHTLKKLKKKISSHRLILINNSRDDISKLTNIISTTTLVQNSYNLGFAAGVNQGIVLAEKDTTVDSVLLLNNDLELTFGTIEMLRKTLFEDKSIGIVSPTLKHAKGFDWGGKFNRFFGNVKHTNFPQKPKKVIKVQHVAGAAMLIKKSLFKEIGNFDERFFLYFEDIDFCLRARAANYSIAIDSEIVANHQVSSSSPPLRKTLYQMSSHIKFVLKHMPSKVYPTAILYNILFYPLVLLKLLITNR